MRRPAGVKWEELNFLVDFAQRLRLLAILKPDRVGCVGKGGFCPQY